ncbi:methyltransferase [Bacteroidia bacterium]|nr:methyltransferase [Bacteroidia bacterium]
MNSNLQIISGAWRGRKLNIPAGARPTQNRSRIALFNILSAVDFGLLTDGGGKAATVWDSFAGSGAIGIEFLSRGWASRAILTDSDASAIKTIRANARDIKGAEIINADAVKSIPKFAPLADLVFIDPPFSDSNLGEKFITEFLQYARPGTIIVWECETGTLKNLPQGLQILKHKTYGRAEFLVMKIS